MSHFAEIDENGIVKRVIVAEQDFIDAEHEGLGPKENWIQTSYNHNIRRTYAGIGWKYHKDESLKDGGIFLHPHEIGKEDEIVAQWKAQGETNAVD
jgi:hypothetical protein